jgi:lipopolysaccharide export system permease protein
MFRRHGGLVRPAGAVVAVTLLVAIGLGVNNLAARSPDLLPLIWVSVLAPLLVAGGMLLANRGPR